jgi:hypothetical protein
LVGESFTNTPKFNASLAVYASDDFAMTAFPPVDDAVLQNNPDFSNLYNKLTNVILNPDGSTKEDPAAKERAVVREVRIYNIFLRKI